MDDKIYFGDIIEPYSLEDITDVGAIRYKPPKNCVGDDCNAVSVSMFKISGKIEPKTVWMPICDSQRYRLNIIDSIDFYKEYGIRVADITNTTLTFREFKTEKGQKILNEVPKAPFREDSCSFASTEYMISSIENSVTVTLFLDDPVLMSQYNNNQEWDLLLTYLVQN